MGEQIGSAAVTGLGMLNPQRWTGGARMSAGAGGGAYRTPIAERDGDGGLLFEIQEEEDKNEKDDDGFGEMQMAKEPEPWGDEKRKSEVPSGVLLQLGSKMKILFKVAALQPSLARFQS